MIAADLAAALDPTILAERSGLVPDVWQRDVLRSTARQTALLCSRQAGKSTVAATMAVHEAIYRGAAQILVLSPSQRQSAELFRKCLDVYRALDRVIPPAAETKLTLELENGSRIISLPGKEQTIRGYSGVSLLIEDEASRVDDALYEAVRPMLAVSGGRIVLLSTPWGKRGHLYREWTEGGPDWQRVKITADACPRIDPDWLAAEKAQIPDMVYRAEYLCEFTETLDSVFRHDDIHAAVDPEVTPLFGVPA